jgi:zeaxanthin glucosyltransferase
VLFRDAPAAIREDSVDALIVDHIEMAGGTIAEYRGLPLVSVAVSLPLDIDPLYLHGIFP